MKTALLTVSALALASFALAQDAPKKKAPLSPHETITASVGGKQITIAYGRPFVKGRNVWEGSLAPYGKVWRTGADEATTFSTASNLMLGSLHVPAGTYALFTIPGEKEWTLILNKVAKQWGAYKYAESEDLGRVQMKARKLTSPIEQLTITIEAGAGNQGTLKIAWSDAEASVPIMMH